MYEKPTTKIETPKLKVSAWVVDHKRVTPVPLSLRTRTLMVYASWNGLLKVYFKLSLVLFQTKESGLVDELNLEKWRS